MGIRESLASLLLQRSRAEVGPISHPLVDDKPVVLCYYSGPSGLVEAITLETFARGMRFVRRLWVAGEDDWDDDEPRWVPIGELPSGHETTSPNPQTDRLMGAMVSPNGGGDAEGEEPSDVCPTDEDEGQPRVVGLGGVDADV